MKDTISSSSYYESERQQQEQAFVKKLGRPFGSKVGVRNYMSPKDRRIFEFLLINPSATGNKISKELGIPLSTVQRVVRYIRERMLTTTALVNPLGIDGYSHMLVVRTAAFDQSLVVEIKQTTPSCYLIAPCTIEHSPAYMVVIATPKDIDLLDGVIHTLASLSGVKDVMPIRMVDAFTSVCFDSNTLFGSITPSTK